MKTLFTNNSSCECINALVIRIFKGNTGSRADLGLEFNVSEGTIRNRLLDLRALLEDHPVNLKYSKKLKSFYFTAVFTYNIRVVETFIMAG